MGFFRRRRSGTREIAPEDIFLDSSNLAALDAAAFEGRVERPLSPSAPVFVAGAFGLIAIAFLVQAFSLQVVQGKDYAELSRENSLARAVLFAPRGIVTDRAGERLIWNDAVPYAASSSATSSATSTEQKVAELPPYPLRHYIERPGFAHLLGFVNYPRADQSGEWWREDYAGVSGAEFVFNDLLKGANGSRLIETNARGEVVRAHVVIPPETGGDVQLSIDADVQAMLFEKLSAHAANQGFRGGAAAIMDVQNGELLALVSFPEYDNDAFAAGDAAAIGAANTDPATPLLNRAVSGLYTPGSIVKPLFAAAALAEGVISPDKEILSTGQLVIPNPYNPDQPSIFKDWKAHGYTDMRRAIAVSSDVYFYAIGGGLPNGEPRQGLGILKIDEYARRFGFGEITGFLFGGEQAGIIPTPEWKSEIFDGDIWRLGDTYNTSIGQYGFQITPLQAVRAAAAIANGGRLLTPQIEHGAEAEGISVGIVDEYLQIAREGMRLAVTDGGTAAALNMSGIELTGKTGTAQTGMRNEHMNSWVIGFWPASAPKYAFAVVLERAPAGTNSGAAPAMRPFFEWLVAEKQEYVQ